MTARIQRQRTKGWRMPPGAIYVGRPSRWGNPFPKDGPWIEAACAAYGYSTAPLWRQAMAVALYRRWVANIPVTPAEGAYIHVEPIDLTEGSQGGLAWLGGVGVIDLPLRPTPTDIIMLRGLTLACWCPLDQPCHADVLAELVQ